MRPSVSRFKETKHFMNVLVPHQVPSNTGYQVNLHGNNYVASKLNDYIVVLSGGEYLILRLTGHILHNRSLHFDFHIRKH